MKGKKTTKMEVKKARKCNKLGEKKKLTKKNQKKKKRKEKEDEHIVQQN